MLRDIFRISTANRAIVAKERNHPAEGLEILKESLELTLSKQDSHFYRDISRSTIVIDGEILWDTKEVEKIEDEIAVKLARKEITDKERIILEQEKESLKKKHAVAVERFLEALRSRSVEESLFQKLDQEIGAVGMLLLQKHYEVGGKKIIAPNISPSKRVTYQLEGTKLSYEVSMPILSFIDAEHNFCGLKNHKLETITDGNLEESALRSKGFELICKVVATGSIDFSDQHKPVTALEITVDSEQDLLQYKGVKMAPEIVGIGIGYTERIIASVQGFIIGVINLENPLKWAKIGWDLGQNELLGKIYESIKLKSIKKQAVVLEPEKEIPVLKPSILPAAASGENNKNQNNKESVVTPHKKLLQFSSTPKIPLLKTRADLNDELGPKVRQNPPK
jgi:hypothetical protein